jgi:hypothetical protein
MEPTTDSIAREAARLIELRQAHTVDEAIELVIDRMDARSRRGVRLPSHGLVRRHVQGFAMQSMGEEAYRGMVRDILRVAEEVMTVFEGFNPVLIGRAAKGQVDAGAAIRVRVYTKSPLDELINLLAHFGYDEPEIETVNTRWGRLNRLVLDEEGIHVIITRCLPEMERFASENLTTGGTVATMTLRALRERLRIDG